MTTDNREVRFARQNVARDEFDEMRIGSDVLYAEVNDDGIPSASAVDVQSVPLPPPDGSRSAAPETASSALPPH